VRLEWRRERYIIRELGGTYGWVSVKPELWTGLDYGLDWTVDWTGLKKTAVYRQQTPPRLQKLVPSSASSCFLAAESSRHCLLDFREVRGHVHI